MPDPPATPDDVPPDIAARLVGRDPDELRAIAEYATEVAEYEARAEEEDESANAETDPDDELPDDVPAKATVVVKTINDNRYYYWQWRDGDSVRSKYKGPVDPER